LFEVDHKLALRFASLFITSNDQTAVERRNSPPDSSLFFAKVLRKFSLDLSASKLGHSLCTLHRANAVGPCTCEDDVHLFQTSALGLWEQEVHCRNKSGVQDCKDDVCPP
jgi:hypothetical protein